MKEIEKVVAENITKLLKEKRITKLELAKIAGVSESTTGCNKVLMYQGLSVFCDLVVTKRDFLKD